MEAFDHWLEFGIIVIALLLLDLLVFNKKAHEVKIKEALLWTGFWIGISLAFGALVYYWDGKTSAMEYFAAYFIEKSLSLDNLFVFLMLFSYFGIPTKFQHRVLYWGILGAIVLRFIFIFVGVELVTKFEWLLLVFGVILIFSAFKMLKSDSNEEKNLDDNMMLKWFRKVLPITNEVTGGHFFERIDGKLFVTPLIVALLMIEVSDIIFAVDSIPAIFGVSTNIFVIYSSNIFAILGLRALYFAISAIMRYFRFLNYGLFLILAFVGVKMILATLGIVHIGIVASLCVIFGTLAGTILLSIIIKKPEENAGKLEEKSEKIK